MKLETQIVTGECPECNTLTMLVSFDTNLYRFVNCGHDLEQKVNCVIKYIPTMTLKDGEKETTIRGK